MHWKIPPYLFAPCLGLRVGGGALPQSLGLGPVSGGPRGNDVLGGRGAWCRAEPFPPQCQAQTVDVPQALASLLVFSQPLSSQPGIKLNLDDLHLPIPDLTPVGHLLCVLHTSHSLLLTNP